MVTKLPSHTTRYFAREAYKLAVYNGKYQSSYKTVQGIRLNCEVFFNDPGFVEISYTGLDNNSYVKRETIRKNWLY